LQTVSERHGAGRKRGPAARANARPCTGEGNLLSRADEVIE